MSGLAGQLAGLEPRDKGRFRRLSDPTGRNVSEARAGLESDNADADLQDWSLRYGLSKAEGVAEIASVGGFVKQYNVVIDPQRLRSFDISPSAQRDPRQQHGFRRPHGGAVQFETVVRGRGYLKGVPDLEKIVLINDGGTRFCSRTWRASSWVPRTARPHRARPARWGRHVLRRSAPRA